MKLWMKVSLICISVLLVVVASCSTLLIINSRREILSVATAGVLAEQKNLKESVSGMASYYGNEDLSDTAKTSLIKYCFLRFADDTSVLESEDETIISNLEFTPSIILPKESFYGQKYAIDEIDGRDILIAGDAADIFSEDYYMYVVKDITPVSESISQMIAQFALISASFILAGVFLIVILVRYSTGHLKKLGQSARLIANGNYGERVKIASRDEVGELSRDFDAMAQAVQYHIAELTESAERQKMFIGGLTHEFKTPLTSVMGHAETLLYTNMPKENAQSSLMHIHEQCKWLERLTQKLLALITLKERIQIENTKVAGLFEDVKSSVAQTLQTRGTSLKISCATKTLPMDKDLMQSLLLNLIDNASKASEPGGVVCLRAYEGTIEVKDEGMGISEQELQRVLEPFYMADKSRSKKYKGSGLGLALVKEIADAHGAKIIIDSAPQKGTSVKVVFPDYKTFTS